MALWCQWLAKRWKVHSRWHAWFNPVTDACFFIGMWTWIISSFRPCNTQGISQSWTYLMTSLVNGVWICGSACINTHLRYISATTITRPSHFLCRNSIFLHTLKFARLPTLTTSSKAWGGQMERHLSVAGLTSIQSPQALARWAQDHVAILWTIISVILIGRRSLIWVSHSIYLCLTTSDLLFRCQSITKA